MEFEFKVLFFDPTEDGLLTLFPLEGFRKVAAIIGGEESSSSSGKSKAVATSILAICNASYFFFKSSFEGLDLKALSAFFNSSLILEYNSLSSSFNLSAFCASDKLGSLFILSDLCLVFETILPNSSSKPA